MIEQELRMMLGQSIKRYRAFRGLSQAELAEMIDISIPFLSDIETGKKWMSDTTIVKIANVLRVEIYELFIPDFNRECEPPQDLDAIVEKYCMTIEKYSAEISCNLSASFDGAFNTVLNNILNKVACNINVSLGRALNNALSKQLSLIFTDFLWKRAEKVEKVEERLENRD